jgi:hypothetical protein
MFIQLQFFAFHSSNYDVLQFIHVNKPLNDHQWQIKPAELLNGKNAQNKQENTKATDLSHSNNRIYSIFNEE